MPSAFEYALIKGLVHAVGYGIMAWGIYWLVDKCKKKD